MKFMKGNFISFLVFVCLAFAPTSACTQTATTLPRSLDQLVDESATIVHGYVVSVKEEPHPTLKNLMTELISLRLVETLKGEPQKTMRFRQYVWDSSNRAGRREYRIGQELLLLLRPVSEYGLTSPAGLDQGRFQISHDSSGKTLAVNGRGNAGLFDSVEQRTAKRGIHLSAESLGMIRKRAAGPVSFSSLEDVIRTLARQR